MSTDTTVYSNGNVPSQVIVGQMNVIVNQNESSGKVTVKLVITCTQNIIDIPVEKSMVDIGLEKDSLKNYNITNSQLYIISNTNPLTQNRVIEYNTSVTITNTNGPTSETFKENNRKK